MTLAELKKEWICEEVKEPQPVQWNPFMSQGTEADSMGGVPREAIGGLQLKSYKGCEENVVVPDYAGKKPVVVICDKAFSPTRAGLKYPEAAARRLIQQVLLPETLLYIGGRAFEGCNFQEIVIPSSVVRIDKESFLNCVRLKKVTVAESTELGNAFAGCTSLADKDGMVIINDVLDCCLPNKKKKIVVPSGVKRIASSALCSCEKVTEIAIPESVEAIDGWLVNFQYSASVRASLKIIGKAGSYAETYAKEQGIAFVAK